MRYILPVGADAEFLPRENIQEHSHMVAVLAHALGLISRDIYGNTYISPETCATVALFHDAPEIITGDMPIPGEVLFPGDSSGLSEGGGRGGGQLLIHAGPRPA